MALNSEMKFQIKGVELLSFELNKPTEGITNEVVFNFNISLEHKINPQDKLIFVLIGINISHTNDEEILGKILVNCIFSIENFKDAIEEIEPLKYNITDGIVELLNSISISTTRGVMASVFKGTILHNAILPIVNPRDLQLQKLPVE